MGIASEGVISCIVGKEALYMYTKDEARYQALKEEGEKLEELLHSTILISKKERNTASTRTALLSINLIMFNRRLIYVLCI